MANINLDVAILIIAIIVAFLCGLGSQWAALKLLLGDTGRFMTLLNKALEDNRIDETEAKGLIDSLQKARISFVSFWKTFFKYPARKGKASGRKG